MADSLRGGIVINEILVDPNGPNNFDTDGNGTASNRDEFVELYNTSNVAIDISGLELWDAGRDNWFTFPPNTVLQPGAYAVVVTDVQAGGSLPAGGPNDLAFDAGPQGPVINNSSDNVVVLDPDANGGDGEYIQATFNNDALDDPTTPGGNYENFPPDAVRVGLGEDFGDETGGLSLQRDGDGDDSFKTDTPTPNSANVCFANGCSLSTPSGPVPIETIKIGDVLLTADQGQQKVIWIWSKTWTAKDIQANSALAPVCFSAGVFAPGVPSQDLRLSQHHRVLVRGRIAQRMFDQSEVLIPAKALLDVPGVYLDMDIQEVEYFHIMLDQHQVIFANQMATESLYLGSQTLKAMSDAALAEICTVLDVTEDDLKCVQAAHPARMLVPVRLASKLVQRHLRNGRSLVKHSQ